MKLKKIQSGRRLDPGPHASQIRFEVEDRGSSLGSDWIGFFFFLISDELRLSSLNGFKAVNVFQGI